jgi:hypothetical protein
MGEIKWRVAANAQGETQGQCAYNVRAYWHFRIVNQHCYKPIESTKALEAVINV